MKTMRSLKRLIPCLIALVLLLPSQAVRAEGPFTDTWKEPVDAIVYNPCNDEWVWLTGSIHIIYHDNLTPSGQLKWETRMNYNRVTGYGMSSGAQYVGVGVDQGGGSTVTADFQGPYHYEVSSQNTMSLIGKGASENYRVHMNFHLTITPDFETTAFVENFRFECS